MNATLDVGRRDEPDISWEDEKNDHIHNKPCLMKGKLTISGLSKGQEYKILRFSGSWAEDRKSVNLNVPKK